MSDEGDDPRQPTKVGRIVLALIGLIVGLILLNGGLNLLGAPPEPVPATTPGPSAATSAPPTSLPR